MFDGNVKEIQKLSHNVVISHAFDFRLFSCVFFMSMTSVVITGQAYPVRHGGVGVFSIMGTFYAFMLSLFISSNRFSFSICSPRLELRLAAGWLIFNCLAISVVVIPSFRCTQKHSNERAWTVYCPSGSCASGIMLFSEPWQEKEPRPVPFVDERVA